MNLPLDAGQNQYAELHVENDLSDRDFNLGEQKKVNKLWGQTGNHTNFIKKKKTSDIVN